MASRHLGKRLVEDRDLDIYSARINRGVTKDQIRRTPKLVQNITLSIPARTDPQKVLAAAQAFGTEHFALLHRHALALHTDTRIPLSRDLQGRERAGETALHSNGDPAPIAVGHRSALERTGD